MDTSGNLRGALTLQFWLRRWHSQELFVKTSLSGFFNSLTLGFEAEADIQTFIDECRNKVFLEEFPLRAIRYDIRSYLSGGRLLLAGY